MGTYGSKVRRAQANYNKRKGLFESEVNLQQSYIDQYSTLTSYAQGKSKPKTRKFTYAPYQRSGYTKAQKEMGFGTTYDVFTYYSPEDKAKMSGGSTSLGAWTFRTDRHYHNAANRTKASKQNFERLAGLVKDKAVKAELGGLKKAKDAYADFMSVGFSTSHLSSANKSQRNQTVKDNKEAKERLATERAIASMQRTGSTSSTSSTSSDNFFGAQRDSSGQLKKHVAPKTATYNGVTVNFTDFVGGLLNNPTISKQVSTRKAMNATTGITMGDTGHDKTFGEILTPQMKKQNTEEKKLQKELDKVKKEIAEYKTKHLTKDRHGNETYYESVKLTEKKDNILRKLQQINNDQKVIAQALESTDYNTVMLYLTKQGAVTEENRLDYLQRSNPNTTVLEQEVQIHQNRWELQNSKTTGISDDITHLKKLQQNNIGGKNQSAIDVFVRGLEDKWKGDINTVYDDGGLTTSAKRVGNRKLKGKAPETSVDGIIFQMEQGILASSKEAESGLRQKYLGAASSLAHEQTPYERLDKATTYNQSVVNKKEFEKLTGTKAGSDAGQSLSSWYETRGLEPSEASLDSSASTAAWLKSIGDTRSDQHMESYVNRDSNSKWFESWLKNEQVFSKDDDLTLWADTDKDKQSKLQKKVDIVKKYDSWEQANKYIKTDLHEWKGDLNTYYGNYYSAPSVTKQDVSQSWFGSSTVTGDSFVGHVNQQMGGVRGGQYWIQDVKKLNKQTKGYEKTMQSQIEERKAKLVGLKLEQSRLDESHRALRPEITTAVDSGIKHGKLSVDKVLADRLGSSSQKLYDINYSVASLETEQEYLEKSLEKTVSEREELEQQRKQREYNQIQNNVGSASPRRIGYSSPGRPSLKQVSRTNTGSSGINTRQSKQRAQRRNTLGGLVT